VILCYPPPRSETKRGRGTMRSMVEGGMRRFSKLRRCCASLFAVAPPTALRAVPPPRCAGRDEKVT
jgi:hypothetical protein